MPDVLATASESDGGGERMIDHPAMPKYLNSDADIAFRSLVKWLREHNGAVHLEFDNAHELDGFLLLTPDDWSALQQAMGE